MPIYLYIGEGAGKTTNALGLALRCIGHKKKVVIIQFMKFWKNLGEIKFSKIKAINQYYKIYQFGRPGWIKINKKREKKEKVIVINGKKFKIRSLEKLDRQNCLEAINFTKKIVKRDRDVYLIVLDEIVLANYLGLVKDNEIKGLLEMIKLYNPKCNVVLTGRYAKKYLFKLSDFVNEIKIVKMPKKLSADAGIQY